MADAGRRRRSTEDADGRVWGIWASVVRWSVVVIGWCLVGAAMLGIVAHFAGLLGSVVARVAPFTPLLVLGGVLGAVVLAVGRRWISLGVAVVVAVGGTATQLPLYVGADEPVRASDITVLQANIYLGQADVGALADLVERRHVDVLTVVELTDDARARIARTAISRRLPFIVGADLNSTFDHRQYRHLLADDAGSQGVLSAAEHTGAGVVPIYPANRLLPALLAIDHILTRGPVPTSFHRADLPGSDHYGVVATIRL